MKALFLILACLLAGLALYALRADQLVVAVGAGVIALWLGSLGLGRR